MSIKKHFFLLFSSKHGIMYYWSKLCKKIRGYAAIDSQIDKTCSIGAGSHIVNSFIDKYSYCGYDCSIINTSVGRFVSIADDVTIGGAFHPIDWVSMSPVFYAGDRTGSKIKFSNHKRQEDKITTIGNDVWIGTKVLIKQGVHIGNGAVIGMGSIVIKDVAPYSIVAGVPSKIIRMRFSDEIIGKLEESMWWLMSEKDLKILSVYIKDPFTFLNKKSTIDR